MSAVLLSSPEYIGDYLGSYLDAPMSVRIAAHLAYAVHNEAEAVYGHEDFRLDSGARKIAAVDEFLGGADVLRCLAGLALRSRSRPIESSLNPQPIVVVHEWLLIGQ